MDGINVIPSDDVAHHACYMVADCRNPRIEIFFIAISQHPIGMGDSNMVWGRFCFVRILDGTIWIKPNMDIQSAFAALFDGKLKRIIPGIRGLALFSGKPLRPGFQVPKRRARRHPV